jgi:hypothetical protein
MTRQAAARKVFGIGLHKTGTTSLHQLATGLGLRSLHDTTWSKPPIPKPLIDRFDAFSDGGGHFWAEDLEFGGNHEVRLLDVSYPGSRFILGVRPLESWLVSKMVHAGWRRGIELLPPRPVGHDDWRYKSVDVIERWIVNRQRYHATIREYFADRPADLLTIDVTRDPDAVSTIVGFLGMDSDVRLVPRVGLRSRAANALGWGPRRVLAAVPHENRNPSVDDQKDFCREIVAAAITRLDPAVVAGARWPMAG